MGNLRKIWKTVTMTIVIRIIQNQMRTYNLEINMITTLHCLVQNLIFKIEISPQLTKGNKIDDGKRHNYKNVVCWCIDDNALAVIQQKSFKIWNKNKSIKKWFWLQPFITPHGQLHFTKLKWRQQRLKKSKNLMRGESPANMLIHFVDAFIAVSTENEYHYMACYRQIGCTQILH